MTEEYLNNPLHGLKLETLITELVDHYGFEILAEALNFNCFRLNPSIKGSYKFLKKTEWAREKIEIFYLYKYKNLPRPDSKQYELPPRDRIIPAHQKPRTPVEFTVEELKEINERKAKQPHKPSGRRSGKPVNNKPPRRQNAPQQSSAPAEPAKDGFDPWGEARKNLAAKNKD
jgi:uncharacterized protein (DUF2132 family)